MLGQSIPQHVYDEIDRYISNRKWEYAWDASKGNQ